MHKQAIRSSNESATEPNKQRQISPREQRGRDTSTRSVAGSCQNRMGDGKPPGCWSVCCEPPIVLCLLAYSCYFFDFIPAAYSERRTGTPAVRSLTRLLRMVKHQRVRHYSAGLYPRRDCALFAQIR